MKQIIFGNNSKYGHQGCVFLFSMMLLLLMLLHPLGMQANRPVSELTPEANYVKGLECYTKKNYKNAFTYFMKAAEGNHVTAQNYIGWMYQKGYGVVADNVEAVKWYRKAADHGNIDAQYNLGFMYEKGYGVSNDYAEAFKWYSKAAEQGDVDAQNNIGYLYEKGFGVTKDYAKAEDCFLKVLKKDPGNEVAKKNLAFVRKEIFAKKSVASTSSSVGIAPVTVVETISDVDKDIPLLSQTNRNTFAVILANEDYQRESKVEFAKNDGKTFETYCRQVLGLPEKNVHFVANATLNNMIAELDWLSEVCKAYKGETAVLFFYAGHGIPSEKDGSPYLLPVDAIGRNLRTCYPVDELYSTLGNMSAKKVVVMMDACFSGTKRSGDMMTSARGIAIKVRQKTPPGNLIVFSAAQGDETAFSYKDAKHGLFTYFLLKKLKETKGSATLGELSKYVTDQVTRYSIVENGKSQTPTINPSETLLPYWKDMRLK